MERSKIDSLMHPVRIQIMLALRKLGTATTRQLSLNCPGVPPATLYRHVAALAKEGILEVAEENRVNGIMERIYRLREDIPAQAEAAAPEELEEMLLQFLLTSLTDLRQYLAGDPKRPYEDFGFRYSLLHLTRAEFARMIRDLNDCLGKYLSYAPSPERKTWRFSTITVPVDLEEKTKNRKGNET